ncbi:uncharacterized protein LOC135845319 [Planococcus citri]|uniref:uncharacterized protein LOC135845319 n=1 Tax=Planococcus citri TaxID=170843 RepID=UPI0031F7AE4B
MNRYSKKEITSLELVSQLRSRRMSTNLTHEGNCSVDCSDDLYVNLYDVPNLEEIASYEVARGIYCSGLEKFHLDNAQDSSRQYRSVQLMKDLHVPRCIKETLQNDLQEVDRSIKRWAEHFLFYMEFPKKFSKYHYEIPCIDPNWLVWSTNREINCIKTAKNMLQVDCLTNVHKFIIMSAYCMEDEMNKFSLHSLPAEFYANVTRSNGWVFFYWICYLRNELCVVTGIRAMAENFNIRDRFINEYFWSFLDDGKQVAVAIKWILLAYQSEEKQKYGRYYVTCTNALFGQIISKMTYNQRQHLFASDMGIFFSLVCSNSPRHVLCIWRRSKNDVTVRTFSMIIGELLFRSKHNPALMSSLTEIWDTASNYQRNFLIHCRSQVCSCIDFCLRNPNLLEFVSKLLHNFSSNRRKRLIFKAAESPRFHECSSESFNFLVNSFLPRFEDQLALKKIVMQSHYFKEYLHRSFIHDQEYEKFIKKIKFYCSYDTRAVQVFVKEFLQNELTEHSSEIDLICNFNRWNKFSEFIDEIFENDFTSGLEVKRKFVVKMMVPSVVQNLGRLDRFHDCGKVIEMVFVGEELKKVKRSFSFFCCVKLIIFKVGIGVPIAISQFLTYGLRKSAKIR